MILTLLSSNVLSTGLKGNKMGEDSLFSGTENEATGKAGTKHCR